MYLKDSTGKKSLTVTVSMITFAVVMIKVLIGGSSFTIGGSSFSFGSIGSDEIIALLGPTLGAYSFRRYTDKKFDEGLDTNASGKDGNA